MLKTIKKYHEKLDLLLKYLVGAVLLAVPLYPKFPFIRVPGTFVSIRLEDLLIVVLALFWFIAILPTVKKLLGEPITKAVLLYLGVALVSLLSAVFITQTVDPSIGFLHWVRRVEYLVPFFAGSYVVFRNKNNLHFYFKLILIVVLFSFIYGFGQKYFSWPIIITQNEEYAKGIALRWLPGSHINSTFAGHYDLASFLVLSLPMIATSFFILKGKITKVVLGTTFVLGLWLMANAVSRISIVAYLGSVGLALVFVKKYKAIPLVFVISIIVFAMTSTVITRYARIFEVVRTRTESQIDKMTLTADPSVYAAEVVTPPPNSRVEDQQASPQPEDRSSSIRFNVEWPRAIRALKKNPLLGTGFSSITLATDNDYLRLLGETGILGFLAFATIFLRLFRLILKTFPFYKNFSGLELSFLAGATSALLGLFLNAVFIDIFEASKFAIIFWFLMGFAVGLIRLNLAGKETKSK